VELNLPHVIHSTVMLQVMLLHYLVNALTASCTWNQLRVEWNIKSGSLIHTLQCC